MSDISCVALLDVIDVPDMNDPLTVLEFLI